MTVAQMVEAAQYASSQMAWWQSWGLTIAIVGSIVMFAYGLERLREVSPKAFREVALGLIACAAVLLILFGAWAALAHDHKHPERTEWLKSLHNRQKALCCDGEDYDTIDDWEASKSGYRVKFRGQWFDVPEASLVDQPNKVGVPMLWMNKGWGGLSVRCFLPGPFS